ncbi:MAG: hypothetical protein AB1758_15170 [Candidatus Eremiobacterota bacterium]
METAADRLRKFIREAPELSALEKFRQAMEMVDSGHEMMRLNLKREYPDESEEQIEARLVAWIRQRPGAEFGDGEGVPSTRRFDIP